MELRNWGNDIIRCKVKALSEKFHSLNNCIGFSDTSYDSYIEVERDIESTQALNLDSFFFDILANG
jgi:hypothetical protein